MNEYLSKLQEIHRNADTQTHKVMLRLFDEKPAERDAAVEEFGMSVPDLADVAKQTPNEKIIKFIASEMSKNKEKEMTPHEWENYLNSYLTSRKDEDKKTIIALTQTAIKYFNKVLNAKISSYRYHTGKDIPGEYLSIHPTNEKGEIELTGTDQIIKFIRKDFIEDAENNGIITKKQEGDFTKFSCDLLIKMYAYEDERQSHNMLEDSRKIFNNYTTNELTTEFRHKEKGEGGEEEGFMIADKSDRNYFSDKRYWITKSALAGKGIKVTKDIYFNIEARAKDSISIERKGQFDPNINSAKALSDIGGIRFIGKTEDELNILLCYQLMKYNASSFRYNKQLVDDFPYGSDKKEKTGKEYTDDQIQKILNYMVRVKDKDVIRTKKIKAENEFGPNEYALDEQFFTDHGIQDPFILQQLRNIVQKKNNALQAQFAEEKKDKDEAKKETLKLVIETTHPTFESFLENEESLEILYRMVKKAKAIGAKTSQLEKIQAVIYHSRENEEIKIHQHNDSIIVYTDNSIKNNKQKNISIQPSEFGIGGKKKQAYYTIHENKFVVKIDDYIINIEDIKKLSDSFIVDRKERESQLKKTKNKTGDRTGKKVGASDWKEVKIEGDMYTSNGDSFSGEHQFLTKDVMKNMKPTTVAEVYDNMKAVFEQVRCTNVATRKDIQDIINNRLIPMLENKSKVQNGLTGKELIEILRKETGGGANKKTLEQKIIDELTERGLRTLTINGEPQEGYYIKPSYVKRLKYNGLWLD